MVRIFLTTALNNTREMTMSNFDRVLSHLGHELEVAVYGDNENVAIECLTCMEVVVDYDQGDDDE